MLATLTCTQCTPSLAVITRNSRIVLRTIQLATIHWRTFDCVTVRSMVNIARLTIWSIYCSRGGGKRRADPLIVAPFIGAA